MIQELAKGIAHKLRQRHTNLRIEGHPKPSSRIIIRNEYGNGIDAYFVPGTVITIYFTIIKNKSRTNWPLGYKHTYLFDLIEPDSIDKIIQRIEDIYFWKWS